MNERIMAAPEVDGQDIVTLQAHVSRDLRRAAMFTEHAC
jgi:hypothetical protein